MRKYQSCKICSLILLLCCLIGAAVPAASAKSYTAETLLKVLPYPDNDPTVIQTPDYDRQIQQQFRQSFVVLMKQKSFLMDLLNTNQVRKTSWFKNLTNNSKAITLEVLADLEKNLQVKPLDDTDFIAVSMSCADPQDAADIVNEAVNLFVAKQRDRRVSDVRNKLVELEKRRNSLERELDLAEKALDDVRVSTGFADLEERHYPSPEEVRLNRLLERKDELVIQIAGIDGMGNVDDSSKDSINAELEQVEKMLAEASAQMKKLDLARVQYKQRAQIRDQILFQLNQIKTLIQKYRILAEDPDTTKVRATSQAVAPISPD